MLVDRPHDLTSQLHLNRTLFNIIWSCVSTTIICAWTSVHPNVPPLNKWKARWNRLRLMFWMIVAPEFVLAWAVRQFFAAREIRDTYNERHPGEYGTVKRRETDSDKCASRFARVEEMDVDARPFIRYGRVHSHRSGS